jgi:triacylglycerol esterase/lipase EstA (alpha/beta hydrolase family)
MTNITHQHIQKIGIVAAVVFLFSFFSHITLSSKALTSETPTPVILVHGYNNNAICPGIDLSTYWYNAKNELALQTSILTNDVVPVSYYKCDTHGVDITGYGPDKTYPFTETTSTVRPRLGHTTSSTITRVGQDLAWFIYNEYTLKGRPVNVVSHSMGGLVTREMLRRIQAHDAAFPPTLDVQKVLTMSTPHNGWGFQCTANNQCAQMSDGSAFLAKLQTNPAPQGVNGTAWWAMATAGVDTTPSCDTIPTNSATAVSGTYLIYTQPCYKHNGYLTDKSQLLDAQGNETIAGRHSLKVMIDIMK